MTAFDLHAIVLGLYLVRRRRSPTGGQCRQDQAVLRRDITALISWATAVRAASDDWSARERLGRQVVAARYDLVRPLSRRARASVLLLASRAETLIVATTGKALPPSPSCTDLVEADLRRRLARIAPGDRLPSQRQLAARIGVSPSTVSLAAQRLAEEGLVASGRGLLTRLPLTAPACVPARKVRPRWGYL
ncbi:GntR family transcriptional regulator [Streptomyces sp. NPDC004111]|uniref:GntR family transcriptional regulator n=1 Tax=Streptomyces sp. NPDC004111 TaxID=3364690 RepID=UPI003680217D